MSILLHRTPFISHKHIDDIVLPHSQICRSVFISAPVPIEHKCQAIYDDTHQTVEPLQFTHFDLGKLSIKTSA